MIDYASLTHNSPFAIKRFTHNMRFNIYCDFLKKHADTNFKKNLLDYGAGDGYLFQRIKEQNIEGYTLHAYEPIDTQFHRLTKTIEENKLDVFCFKDISAYTDILFDYVICAEVLEHFSAINVLTHLNTIRSILSDDGRLLISVPLEVGLAGIFKNFVRKIIGQSHGKISTKTLLDLALDRPVYRGDDLYIGSHIGFSYNKLRYLIVESGFKIERTYYSPFKILGALANSQVFFECAVEKPNK